MNKRESNKENLISVFRLSSTLLFILIALTLFPVDFSTFHAWTVFLIPLGFYMSLISIGNYLERFKNKKLNVPFVVELGLFYLLAIVLVVLTGGVSSSYKVILPLPFFLYGLDKIKDWLAGAPLKDELTGLLNKRFFNYKLQKLLKKAKGGAKIGLILIQLNRYDDFKETWGFCAESILLKSISDTLRMLLDKNDLAAYCGGGRFAVLTRAVEVSLIIAKAEKMRKRLTVEMERGMEEGWSMPVAVGVSVFPDHAANGSSLGQSVENALLRALSAVGGRVQVYYPIFDRFMGKMDRHSLATVKEVAVSMQEQDMFAYVHSERVLIYSQLICRGLKLTIEQTAAVEYAAFLHDIRPLLKGPEIDRCDFLGTQIIIVAEYFDYLTAERPYGRGKTIKEGIQYLLQKKNTFFDPMVVNAFVNSLTEYEDISQLIEWPKGLGRIVPSGYGPGSYVLGGHYAEYYSGKLHFIIKAVPCIAVGIANNEKCFYVLDEVKEQFLLQQLNKFFFDGQKVSKTARPGQVERAVLPDYLLKMDWKTARFELEMKKVFKAWLDDAEKEGFDSIRLIIDHSFLKLGGEELITWEMILTRCINNMDAVIVCYYEIDAKACPPDTLGELHSKPLLTKANNIKEKKDAT